MSPARHRVIASLSIVAVLSLSCTSQSSTEPIAGPRSDGAPVGVGFVDVADDVGLAFEHGAFHWGTSADPGAMLGGGVCWLDYDADGWMDLFVVNSYARSEAARWHDLGGLPQSVLFHNVEGRFRNVTDELEIDLRERGNGCVAADLDNDGRTDLYVTGSNRSHLLWNEGDRFREGAEAAGVEAFGWYAGAAAGDVNGDGWLDLFVAGYVDLSVPLEGVTLGFPNTYAGVRDLLYLSNGEADGEVTFREVGRDSGLEVVNFAYGLGASFWDPDRDGDLDLYVANDTNPNRLYKNVRWPGGAKADPAGLGFRFEDVAPRAGVADPNSGMGIAAADYDSDGLVDLFVTNARNQVHAAYRGQTSETVAPSFLDSRADFGEALGGSTGWGTTLNDLDLDGDLDLVLVNGDIPVTDLTADAQALEAYENVSDPGIARFEDASSAFGLDRIGETVGRGSAAADYDNDGDMDIAINSIGGRLMLLENRTEGGNALEVAVNDPEPGVLVTVVLQDGDEVTRELRSGSSYLSSEDPRAHFGLGDVDSVTRVTVEWPDGRRSVVDDVTVNEIVFVEAP